MSLKNLIKVADYYNVKYGFGKIAGGFNLKEFKMPPHNEWRDVWGGGHTTETDPSRNGWKCRPVPGRENLAIIGQPGKPGCASVRSYDDYYDVAFYYETPNEVQKGISNNDIPDAHYEQYGKTPGWGLYVIDEIERMRKNMSEDDLTEDEYYEGVESSRPDDDGEDYPPPSSRPGFKGFHSM